MSEGLILNEEQRERLVRAYADRLILNQAMKERDALRYAEDVVNNGMAVAPGQRWRMKDEPEDLCPQMDVTVDQVFASVDGDYFHDGFGLAMQCQFLVNNYVLVDWDEAS